MARRAPGSWPARRCCRTRRPAVRGVWWRRFLRRGRSRGRRHLSCTRPCGLLTCSMLRSARNGGRAPRCSNTSGHSGWPPLGWTASAARPGSSLPGACSRSRHTSGPWLARQTGRRRRHGVSFLGARRSVPWLCGSRPWRKTSRPPARGGSLRGDLRWQCVRCGRGLAVLMQSGGFLGLALAASSILGGESLHRLAVSMSHFFRFHF